MTSPAAGGLAGLAPGTKYVVVQAGDCLSAIAQEHLGSWQLDSEIHDLNVGRPQPDGRVLTDDHWIYPGWVLVMPANAAGTRVAPPAGSATQPARSSGSASPTSPSKASPPRSNAARRDTGAGDRNRAIRHADRDRAVRDVHPGPR